MSTKERRGNVPRKSTHHLSRRQFVLGGAALVAASAAGVAHLLFEQQIHKGSEYVDISTFYPELKNFNVNNIVNFYTKNNSSVTLYNFTNEQIDQTALQSLYNFYESFSLAELELGFPGEQKFSINPNSVGQRKIYALLPEDYPKPYWADSAN